MMRARECLKIFAALLALALPATSAQASPFILTNAVGGDGSVSVGVDGFGAFGSSAGANTSNAVYDPVGGGGPAGTTFQSALAIRFGSSGGRSWLASGSIDGSAGLPNPTVTGSSTSGASSFTSGSLSFSLTQTVVDLVSGMSRTGSLLTQTYTITNTSPTAAVDFELVRYLDGDLVFDGSFSDGGGRLISGSTEILFETDTAAGTATSTTFVGITAAGGSIPGTNRYEVDSFAGLRGRIAAGTALDDTVSGDSGDADQFIDAGGGYDVTLALRNLFHLGVGESATYTTQTIFGSGAPQDVEVPNAPEPASLAMLSFGVLGMVGYSLKRRRNAQLVS